MYTYTISNPATGVTVTSREMTKDTCEALVEMSRKNAEGTSLVITINEPDMNEEAEKIHQEIQELFEHEDSKKGATGICIYNKATMAKADKLSWKLYGLRSAQKQALGAKSDSRRKLH